MTPVTRSPYMYHVYKCVCDGIPKFCDNMDIGGRKTVLIIFFIIIIIIDEEAVGKKYRTLPFYISHLPNQ